MTELEQRWETQLFIRLKWEQQKLNLMVCRGERTGMFNTTCKTNTGTQC